MFVIIRTLQDNFLKKKLIIYLHGDLFFWLLMIRVFSILLIYYFISCNVYVHFLHTIKILKQ
jgi:hypothetical protein